MDNDLEYPQTNFSTFISEYVNNIFNIKININTSLKDIATTVPIPAVKYNLNSETLQVQIENNIKATNVFNKLEYNCRLIDYVDCVHDFKSCNRDIESKLGISNINLCTENDNINIDKSHKIQETCIEEMYKILINSGITVPTLNKSFFIPKDELNKYLISRNINKKSIFYLESGRTPDIEGTDAKIQEKTIGAIYDGCGHSGISFNDVKDNNKLNTYIEKNSNDVNTDFIKNNNYVIKMYGNLVTVNFYPQSMSLKVLNNKTNKSIKIELINNAGITVNSILTKFDLYGTFPKAERGTGNETSNFNIIEDQIQNDEDQIQNDENEKIFLATCLKTVCDKIVSTEINPDVKITDITTVDGYVWAGVTYKYLIGEYSQLPTIYESVKNGWNVRPGIYDMSKEISENIIRVLHLMIYFKIDIPEKFSEKFRGFISDNNIIEQYTNLFKNHYDTYKNCITNFNTLTINQNVFYFLSYIKILSGYFTIEEKIKGLKEKLEIFKNDPNTINLFNIPLLEDIFKNTNIDDAMNNQQTLIFDKESIYDISITPDEQKFVDVWTAKYKTPSENTFVGNDKDILDDNGNCKIENIKKKFKPVVETTINEVCDDFKEASRIQKTSSITKEHDLNIWEAIKDGLVTFEFNETFTHIILRLNTDPRFISTYSKNNRASTKMSDIKNWFTSNVYFNLNDDENVDNAYITHTVDKINYVITGPLEMEIIWILSLLTLLRPLLGSKRTNSTENEKRMKTVRDHGKILYNYLKPEFFTDDNDLQNFQDFYVDNILLNIQNQNYKKENMVNIPKYLDKWSLRLPEYILIKNDIINKSKNSGSEIVMKTSSKQPLKEEIKYEYKDEDTEMNYDEDDDHHKSKRSRNNPVGGNKIKSKNKTKKNKIKPKQSKKNKIKYNNNVSKKIKYKKCNRFYVSNLIN